MKKMRPNSEPARKVSYYDGLFRPIISIGKKFCQTWIGSGDLSLYAFKFVAQIFENTSNFEISSLARSEIEILKTRRSSSSSLAFGRLVVVAIASGKMSAALEP